MVSYLRKYWCRGSIQRQSSGPDSPPIVDRSLRPDVRFRYLLLVSMSFLLFLPLFVTCGKDSPTQPKAPEPTPPPPPSTPVATRVEISHSSATLISVGQTFQLTARVFDQNSAAMNAAVVTWTSSAVGVAKVSTQGLVTAVSNGSATITARSGSASTAATVTVMQSVGSIAIEPSSATRMALGETVQFTATVLDGNGQPVADAVVTWWSSDAGVATVSTQGLVTAVSNGSANISAASGTASARIAVIVPAMDDSMDRDALIALYNSTDGPNWTVSTNWLSGAPLDQWHGVSTSSDGRVASLRLTGNGLRGTIPTELGTLKGLNVLDFSNNVLVGIIPPDLGELTQLRELRLAQNSLSGPIPPELGKLDQLSRIYLDENTLTGAIPPELGNLTSLSVLYLDYNQLTGPIPPELGRLVELSSISLDYNQLTGPIPPEFGNLTRLSQLSMDHNQLSGPIPSELGNLARLQRVFLHGNKLSGPIPRELGNLSYLENLWLASNQLSGPIPRELGNLRNLHNLLLSGNRLSGTVPPELGNLGNLVVLALKGNLLEGSIPQSFLQLNRLESIGCRETKGLCLPATVAFREWARQVEARGNVDFPVDIPYCDEIDRAGLVALYESANGTDWSFSDGWINDENLDRWYGVQTDSIGRVFSLDLNSNGLSGNIPEALGMLANMKKLRIGNNALSGRLPLSLAAVPLEEFDYAGTSLCVADDSEFQDWLDGIPQHSGTEVQCAPLTEREILASLYWSAGGPSWTNAEGWLTNTPLSSWHGVETDDTGRVGSLILRRNGLSGLLPTELGQLVHLRVLDLHFNGLSGPIPPALGDLERLEHLDLGFNQLRGDIPAELGQLARLRFLFLNYNSLTGSIPLDLGGLANLVTLNLAGNGLTGPLPAELGDLSNLTLLNLSRTQITGPIPAEFARMTELRELNLYDNNLSGSIPAELGDLSNLTLLNLSRTQVTGSIPAELGKMTELRELNLYDNNLSGSLPAELGDLSNLTLLNLSRTQVTGPIPAELGKMAELRELNLNDNNLSGSIPAELGDLSNLTDLNLSDNQLTGPIPADLGRAGSLEHLNLRSNELSGPVPPEFGNLTMLTSLVLAENPGLAGRMPSEITALENLELLMAGGTGLCRPADDRFDVWFQTIANRRLVVCEGGASVYLTQSVQSWDDPVPLLAGEPALLRVFVTGSQETGATMPDVRATFYVNGAERHTVHIPSSTQALPSLVNEGDLELSANAEIPAWIIAPGLEMVIEVDPDGTLDPALGATMRIPEAGRLPVDVRTVPSFHLTLIPFLSESEPDGSIVGSVEAMAADPYSHELLRDVRTLLPIVDFDVAAHETVISSTPNIFEMLAQVEVMRLMEDGTGSWMGIFARTPGTQAWPTGAASTYGPDSVSELIAGTIAHELGHNLNLMHAPCGGTDPGTDDPWFPHPGGRIGVWGYNFEQRALVSPSVPDVMSYCFLDNPYWISDFFFNKALDHRLTYDDGAVLAAAHARTLLLWGGRDEDGVPHLDPAFAVDAVPSQPLDGGAYTIEGITADDEILFSFSFDMPVNPDAQGEETSFVFTLPVQYGWAGNLESITLSGPEGTAVLDKSTNRPMAILQDPVTRQVRAFLSDLPAGGSDRAVAARATVVDPGLEMIFSRGIPDLR